MDARNPDIPRESRTLRSGSRGAGLSTRLMVLTVLFVLVAEVLIYLPSIANFRSSWLNDRVAQARAAALILDKAPADSLPRPLVDELLAGIDTTMIAIRIEQSRRLLAMIDMPPTVDFEVDLRNRMLIPEIMNSLDILINGGARAIRVVGPAPEGGEFVEIVISERPLRAAMISYSWSVLQLSLLITVSAALIVFAALSALIVRPVKRLAAAIMRFRDHPEDARTLIRASWRSDEIGTLERELGEMQASIQQQLRQREHLANLGLAVAKINHDLRNMLASAQLMADRLGAIPDANVQLFVPKLLDALDRAIGFCKSTLAYGKAQEAAPEFQAVALAMLAGEVSEQLGLGRESRPSVVIDIAPALVVRADPAHLQRVLMNLVRNARAALEAADIEDGGITIEARQVARRIEIDVADNGPGVPRRVRDQLFRPFTGASGGNGTGLGLAIARELMRAMGGDLVLIEPLQGREATPRPGARFRLTLPQN